MSGGGDDGGFLEDTPASFPRCPRLDCSVGLGEQDGACDPAAVAATGADEDEDEDEEEADDDDNEELFAASFE